MLGLIISFCKLSPATAATSTVNDRKRVWMRIGAAVATLRNRIQLRAAEAQLHALDRRMLKDIGLDRSEIRSVLTDRTGERSIGVPNPLALYRPATEEEGPNSTSETVMTFRVVAASCLMLAAAVAGAAALATTSSNMPRAEARSTTRIDPSIDASAIGRRDSRDLPVESYPSH